MIGKFDLVIRNFKYHGFSSAVYELTLRVINKFIFLKILHCFVLSKETPELSGAELSYDHGFLSKEDLNKFSTEISNQLPASFLDSALSKGDKCYAFTKNGELAAYTWYSNTDTLTDIEGLAFSCDPCFIYIYKGFTNPKFRGHKLHSIGKNLVLKHYLALGFKGIISYADSVNFDSLKSSMKMDHNKLGKIVITKVFEKTLRFTSKSTKPYSIRLKSVV